MKMRHLKKISLCIMIFSVSCFLPPVLSGEQIFDGGAPLTGLNTGILITTDVGASDFVVLESSVLTDVHFWTLEPFTITPPLDGNRNTAVLYLQ